MAWRIEAGSKVPRRRKKRRAPVLNRSAEMSGPIGDDATTAGLDFAARQRRKYVCRNPVQRFLLRRFFRRLRAWIDALAPKSVLDFGCGEGFFWQRLAEWGPLPP